VVQTGRRSSVRTQVDVTERTATNLAANSVLVADTEILQELAAVFAAWWMRAVQVDAASGVLHTIVVMVAGRST
jgi:hypothetical protein